MNPDRESSDATLLCEGCGYVLEGLDAGGACPECGRPIVESLPGARTGSPFQNDPTWRGFIRQCVMLIREPGRLFARARIGHSADAPLLFRSVAVASIAALAPLCGFALAAAGRSSREHDIIAVLMFLFSLWGVFTVLLLVLTTIERVGITFFANRRGWRVPPPVARTICANAAPGWIAAGVLCGIGLCAVPAMLRVARDVPPPWRTTADAAAASPPLLGFIAGMIVFEMLVYVGVRRCRYANWAARP
ncbi:MAG: hypothetical protein KF869_12385 [Phycisphaeraceae bacterium]|nr:hypothetical protein [Phycisphaeraceae bacterium]